MLTETARDKNSPSSFSSTCKRHETVAKLGGHSNKILYIFMSVICQFWIAGYSFKSYPKLLFLDFYYHCQIFYFATYSYKASLLKGHSMESSSATITIETILLRTMGKWSEILFSGKYTIISGVEPISNKIMKHSSLCNSYFTWCFSCMIFCATAAISSFFTIGAINSCSQLQASCFSIQG